MGKNISQVLFPAKCLKCGTYLSDTGQQDFDDAFCPVCMPEKVRMIESPMCPKCGLPHENKSAEDHLCESCLTHPLKLSKVRACSSYDGILKEAIHLLKYRSELSLAKWFETMVCDLFMTEFFEAKPDVIMPVPLHKNRLRQRGFNQAYILVRNLKNRVSLKCGEKPAWQLDIRSLVRNRKTQPQTGLAIDQRKKNLKNAFAVTNAAAVKDKYVLLIDDVLTTGATCNEAAGQLIRHGARKVDALVIARTSA